MELRARAAAQDDVMVTYAWANDPLTRAMSVTSGTLPLDTYKRFFSLLLHDEDVLFLIIEGFEDDNWSPIAQVKLHADGIISVSVAQDYRGRRLATPVIVAALEFAKGRFPVDTVTARIHKENVPSIRAFERVGFIFSKETICKEQPCVEYSYKLSDLY